MSGLHAKPFLFFYFPATEVATCSPRLPIFKQGTRDDPNNYRPIFVISVVPKLFERIVHDQLCSLLELHNVICKYQSGFRTIHSTVTALPEIDKAAIVYTPLHGLVPE